MADTDDPESARAPERLLSPQMQQQRSGYWQPHKCNGNGADTPDPDSSALLTNCRSSRQLGTALNSLRLLAAAYTSRDSSPVRAPGRDSTQT
eukprot:354967-Chlamydomonas_euryale.AAC.1